MNRSLQILILSADAGRARQWSQCLADADTQVWQDVRQLPRDRTPDVIVADRGLGGGDAPANEALQGAWLAHDVGVVTVGEAGSGDVARRM